MGVVWRATDTVLDREVAVKVLKPEYADDPTFRSRFEAEARHAAALHHHNIASVFDFGELDAERRLRGAAALPGDGAGPRRAALGAAARRRADAAGDRRRPRRAGRRRPRRRARARHRPPRRQAGQPAGDPRRPGQDHRLRHRPGRRRRGADPDRPGHRHPRLPLARSRPRAPRDPGQRHLLPRRGALRVPRRHPPVRRRHPGEYGAGAPARRSAAAARPGARPPARGGHHRAGQGPAASGSPR